VTAPFGRLACVIGLFALLSTPALATVTIVSFTPSPASPEPIGKTITWTATATDTGAGPFAFQFNIMAPNTTQFALVKDFNIGTLSAGIWTAHPFVWVPTGIEGIYKLQVVVKDFSTNQTTSRTASFEVAPVASSKPIAEHTANALVALFSAPSCAAGSTMRVIFVEQSGGVPATATNWVGCHPPATMTFEIAGMYPSTAYNMYAQTKTGTKTTNGATVTFTTSALPTNVSFPVFTPQPAGTDTTNPLLLHTMIALGGATVYPDVATDLEGKIVWYYYANDTTHTDVLTRPLPGGGNLTLQDDPAWDPNVTQEQFLRQIDLAGNLVRETNMGAIQQQLLALGAVDGGPCNTIPVPAPVGAGCVGAFHHDAIQTLPNGYSAALLDIEKIFPAGTQGDASGLPVDVIGDMIIVMNSNWQVVWYWDSFNPAGGGGGYPLLPVSRTAVLSETCGASSSGCPPIFLLDSGYIAPLAHDWLHANSLYYWPNNGSTTSQPGDIIWSARHQDWVMKIDYKDGAGTGNIIWCMGPSGNFTFDNIYNDPWPWFSHQHDAGIENGGAGPVTIFDNGDTRISAPSESTGGVPGLGTKCKPNDCDSRGMAVTFVEPAGSNAGTVTPVASFDLGAYSTAMGSAQLLANGNYFFENPQVLVNLNTTAGYSLEIAPTPPAPQVGAATIQMDVAGPMHYRGWQMPNLYDPPTT